MGQHTPWAPQFQPGNAEPLRQNFARPRLAGAASAIAWLAASGRVDRGAERLRVAIDLVETLADRTRFDFALA